jgi:hypothetical protein
MLGSTPTFGSWFFLKNRVNTFLKKMYLVGP